MTLDVNYAQAQKKKDNKEALSIIQDECTH